MALELHNRDGTTTVVGRVPRAGGGYETGAIGTRTEPGGRITNRVPGSVLPGQTITEAKQEQAVKEQKTEQKQKEINAQTLIESINQSAIRSGSAQRYSTRKNPETGEIEIHQYTTPGSIKSSGYEPIGSTPGGFVYTPTNIITPDSPIKEKNYSEQTKQSTERKGLTMVGPFLASSRGLKNLEKGAEFFEKISEKETKAQNEAPGYLVGSSTKRYVSDVLGGFLRKTSEKPTQSTVEFYGGIAGGQALGLAGAGISNVAGRTLGPTAYKVSNTVLTTGLVGAGAISTVITPPKQIGESIPLSTGLAIGIPSGYEAGSPGVKVLGFKEKSATSLKTTVEKPTNIISGIGQRNLVADVSVFGETKSVPVSQSVILSGTSGSKGEVTVSLLGSVEAGGKTFPASQISTGRISGNTAAFKTGDEVFTSITGKPTLIARTPEAGEVFTAPVVYQSSSSPTLIGRTNVVFTRNTFDPEASSLVSVSRPRTLTETTSVVPGGITEASLSPGSITRRGQRLLSGGEKVSSSSYVSLARSKRAGLGLVQETVPTVRPFASEGVGESSILLSGFGVPKVAPTSVLPLSFGSAAAGVSAQRLSTSIFSGYKQPSSVFSPGLPSPQNIVSIDTSNRSASIPSSSVFIIPSISYSQRQDDKAVLALSQAQQQSIKIPSGPASFPFGRGNDLNIPGFVPPVFGGSSGGGVGGFLRRFRKRESYAPSLTASAFDIRGVGNQRSGGYTGLEVRPLSGGNNRKKYIKRGLL